MCYFFGKIVKITATSWRLCPSDLCDVTAVKNQV